MIPWRFYEKLAINAVHAHVFIHEPSDEEISCVLNCTDYR